MAKRLMQPADYWMVVGSTPATTRLRLHCEKMKRLTECTRVLDCFLRVILEQNLLRGPHGLPGPMYHLLISVLSSDEARSAAVAKIMSKKSNSETARPGPAGGYLSERAIFEVLFWGPKCYLREALFFGPLKVRPI